MTFTVEIHTPSAADLYVSSPALDPLAWSVVKELDRAAVAAVGDLPELEFDRLRVKRIMSGCSGVVVVLQARERQNPSGLPRVAGELAVAAELGLRVAIVHAPDVHRPGLSAPGELPTLVGGAESIPFAQAPLTIPVVAGERLGAAAAATREGLDRFLAAAGKPPSPIRPYAFLIGRLERDFTHARSAIRAAVEAEAGITCLWADDGRHRTNIDSIRENTRLLIKHAAFVVADLTLGVESPERENPSRAHEIGMSIAYDRRLMLCSQEPRRYPYFSIGDMQMVFWATESELNIAVREWIRARRHLMARMVFNHQLEDVYPDYDPRLGRPVFAYDPALRYIGPHTSVLDA
jgi:hypothetical protein